MASEMVRVKTKKSIDLAKYVNTETGEYLAEEVSLNKGMITQYTEDGKYVIIKSDSFTIIDADAMEYLSKVLNKSEVGSMMVMANDLKTPFNLIFNHNRPHTHDTLQEAIGFKSKSMFIKFMGKLMKLGVLYQVKGNIMGEVRVIYMMNPLVARKRSKLDSQVFDIFKKLQ
jgi:hypothetical protein